jgi:response regulator RpfG family c-di-GMP phosphodiesterase
MRPPQFLIIDDDPINNFICRKTIQMHINEPSLFSFTEATHALDFLSSKPYIEFGDCSTILLLDLNMPLFSGWDFLDAFHRLQENVKVRHKIYVLTSSHNPEDLDRAKGNCYVKDYIVKPILLSTIVSISS